MQELLDNWLENEELERNVTENDSYKEKRSDDDTGGNLGEELRDIVTALEST